MSQAAALRKTFSLGFPDTFFCERPVSAIGVVVRWGACARMSVFSTIYAPTAFGDVLELITLGWDSLQASPSADCGPNGEYRVGIDRSSGASKMKKVCRI